MKKTFFFILLTMLLCAGSAFAATGNVTVGNWQFLLNNAEVKQLGEGVFEVTLLPVANRWPLVLVTPPDVPARCGVVQVTLQKTTPEGPLPKRLRLLLEPAGCADPVQLANELADNKPHTIRQSVRASKKMAKFSLAAHSPDQAIKVIISGFQAGAAPKAPRVTPLPPVMFQGKPIFPISAWDFNDVDRKNGALIDPGLLVAGFNMGEVGVLGLPGDKWYEKHRQPAMFARLDELAKHPEYRHIAWIVGVAPNFYMDDSQGGKDYFVPVTGAELEKRKAILAADLKRLSQYPNVIGYQIDEPENVMYEYYSKHFKDQWDATKDAGLAVKMQEWTEWLNSSVRKNHPDARLMPILGWWTTYLPAAKMYDINFPNSYPKPDDLMQVNYDAAKAVDAARRAGGGRTVVYMPAMFDNLPGRTIYNRAQVRYACFAPITRGVMGIYGWRLLRCSEKYRDRVVYPTLREISNLTPYFLGTWHDELVTSDHDQATVDYLQKFQERSREVDGKEDAAVLKVADAVPDVSHCLRRDPATGKYLLIAVNNRRDKVTVNFQLDLDNLPKVLLDALDLHQVRVRNGGFSDDFEPFGVHAYLIEPAGRK